MIATDPLSLAFVACIVFSGGFLIATTLLGLGHGHGMHVHMGHSGGHLAHGPHAWHIGAHHTGASATATPVSEQTLTPKPGMRVPLPTHTAPAHQANANQSAPASALGRALGAVNINSVLIFLFFFGLLGYILHNQAHLNALIAILFAIVIGVVTSGAMNALLLRLMGRETGNLGYDSSQMEGRIAHVSLPIRAGGLGEIIYVGENGSRRSLGARSADGQAIERDADVVITAYAQGIATVETWDDFLLSARGSNVTPAQLPG